MSTAFYDGFYLEKLLIFKTDCLKNNCKMAVVTKKCNLSNTSKLN